MMKAARRTLVVGTPTAVAPEVGSWLREDILHLLQHGAEHRGAIAAPAGWAAD
jgi:hypothetical protein